MEIFRNNNVFLRENNCETSHNSCLLNCLDRFGPETVLGHQLQLGLAGEKPFLDYVKLLPIVNNGTLTEVIELKLFRLLLGENGQPSFDRRRMKEAFH